MNRKRRHREVGANQPRRGQKPEFLIGSKFAPLGHRVSTIFNLRIHIVMKRMWIDDAANA